MREGYGSRLVSEVSEWVCVCVSVTVLAATYLAGLYVQIKWHDIQFLNV